MPALLEFLGKSIRIIFGTFWSNGQSVEHDNAYVRSSAAAAFTEAVERWPASITETVDALLHLYHEKVACRTSSCKKADCFQAKILAPEFDQYVRCQLSPIS